MKKSNNLILLAITIAFVLGVNLAPQFEALQSPQTNDGIPAKVVVEQKVHYTCPMHSHIHTEKEGECPICGMDLVIKKSSPAEVQDDAENGALVSTHNKSTNPPKC